MKEEFDLEETWLPFEIHPDTPVKGILFKDAFPGYNSGAFLQSIGAKAKEVGVVFGEQELMCNSRKALICSEYAREKGLYEEFHTAVFEAYFTNAKDIGEDEVLFRIGEEVGLEREGIANALQSKVYVDFIEKTIKTAKEMELVAAPTFFIEGYGRIVGAVSVEEFRQAFKKAQI